MIGVGLFGAHCVLCGTGIKNALVVEIPGISEKLAVCIDREHCWSLVLVQRAYVDAIAMAAIEAKQKEFPMYAVFALPGTEDKDLRELQDKLDGPADRDLQNT